MRIIQIAVLAWVATLVLPLGGFTQRASTMFHDLQHQWEQLSRSTTYATDGTEHFQFNDFRNAEVHIRAAATTSSGIRGVGNPGDGLRADQRVQGEVVACPDGSSTAEWLHVVDNRTQVNGFVSRCFL